MKLETLRRRRWLLALLLALLGLAGCAALLRPAPIERPQLSTAIERGTLEHDGLERSYELFAPTTLEPGAALLLVLHGSDMAGDAGRDYLGWQLEPLAEREGILLVYPEGVELEWNGCRSPGVTEADRRDLDDVGFVLALIERFIASHAIDPRRVYALGFSNGGQMAYRLAADAPERFAAAAAVIANVPVASNSDCNQPRGPIPLLILNGDADPIIPWDGGEASMFGFSSRGEVRSAADSAAFWREVNGLADAEPNIEALADTDTADGSWIERFAWGAESPAPVVLLRVHGGGHNFPGGIELGSPWLLAPIFGRANADVDGAELVWAFLSRHPGDLSLVP